MLNDDDLNTPRQQKQKPSQTLQQSFLGQAFFTNNIKLRTLTLFETTYSVWLLGKIIKKCSQSYYSI